MRISDWSSDVCSSDLACDIANPVWEPCGRGGAITAEMEAAGFRTIATDLIADPAHRVTQQDLLACHHAFSPVVVTNPPFALAEAIIRHLLVELRCRYVALLLKSTFWRSEEHTSELQSLMSTAYADL